MSKDTRIETGSETGNGAQGTTPNAPTTLITGASQGLGKFLAQSFWKNGYSLILVDRDTDALRKLQVELLDTPIDTPINTANANSKNQEIHIYSCDLAKESGVDQLIKTLYLNHKSIEVLINNAAIQGPMGTSQHIWEDSPDAYRETIQVNLLAPIELCSRLVPLLTKTSTSRINQDALANLSKLSNLSGGSIINLSGGGATGPRANFSAYATAKAGLVRFSETLAEELSSSGVRVNCIAPGAMKTAMTTQVEAMGRECVGDKEFAGAQRVLAEGGTSMERVAELALFLAGSDSKGITGKLISAVWDNWRALLGPSSDATHSLEAAHKIQELSKSDVYTLRRIGGRDRGMPWADH